MLAARDAQVGVATIPILCLTAHLAALAASYGGVGRGGRDGEEVGVDALVKRELQTE